ncbi:DUF5672 family protein [Mucilaginibacter phyllosphaerae]|uniref:DUF5672 domain-containing protein n=1 Tax=Mucilaginibacter phyllosphaerae TaxID=1812349 RepID=A0A4Y8AG85_9SPHI|nr:DUF5672 family protein [Mucilaginibacter phyllosphaerae]MBB3969035.1 hypothetical protein [Mucilaginibacter phyllosphaerae]TEW67352.1 hypothetical protein E2R65_05005 [Mucilaginibacter phyllosphaerae]GGH23660.1 hypothetical protein GCM10007352_37650 [Mucilaginibacter phyllosphaerae]
MEALNKVAVIIPFYRDLITDLEEIALQQCQKVLGNYHKIAIKPQSLALPQKAQQAVVFNQVVSFANPYFDGIRGYNSLMLSDVFYKAFLDYDYILIYQLDAFVFKDELMHWCSLGFDYIGAPWLRRKGYQLKLKEKAYQFMFDMHTRFNVKKNGVPTDKQFYNKVGNGGLSLRRVKKFYALSIKLKPIADDYLKHTDDKHNEDVFWSIEVNRSIKRLKIPGYKTAVKFSIELEPARAFALNEGRLPFGCHAWDLYTDFWRPEFKVQGYHI